MRLIQHLLYLFILSASLHNLTPGGSSVLMVEICDNGIDDDMDGLIDINDNDCQCAPVVPSGLIPNPSFEARSCCPQVKGRLDCADSWIQASAATTDYVNSCGFLGNVIDVPLPIADGQGAIGIRDGSPDNGNYKEYAGACLSEPIESGKSYRLRLNVGFTTASTSPRLNLSIYGNPNCSSLPFGNGNASIGCPLNVTGWIELGSVSVNGLDEWVDTEIEFTTTEDIRAVAIGPGCSPRPVGQERYYFFDNLRLAETIDFGYQVHVDGGNPCRSDFNLSIGESVLGESYQWYRNGVAIQNATNTDYSVPDDESREAKYQVRIEDMSGCQLTDEYEVVIFKGAFTTEEITCANTTYQFGSQNITTSGMYFETFMDMNGCDSTVNLQLTFRDINEVVVDTTICRGQHYLLGLDEISASGEYFAMLQDQLGCDSLVTLQLSVKEPAAQIDLSNQVISLGDEFNLDLQGQENNLIRFQWASNLQGICLDCPSQTINSIDDAFFALDALDINNCAIRDTLFLAVDKDYKVFIPNAFSPNGDGRNDTFTLYPSKALGSVKSFRIFDRWGNMMYEALEIQNLQWDGTHKGKSVNMDTYIYTGEVVFIDGFETTLSGSVQLIR